MMQVVRVTDGKTFSHFSVNNMNEENIRIALTRAKLWRDDYVNNLRKHLLQQFGDMIRGSIHCPFFLPFAASLPHPSTVLDQMTAIQTSKSLIQLLKMYNSHTYHDDLEKAAERGLSTFGIDTDPSSVRR